MASLCAQTVYDNESPATTLSFQFFASSIDGFISSPIANPDPSGINTSAMVMEHSEPADAMTFAGSFTNPNPVGGITATPGSQICIDVWFDTPGALTLKLEGDDPAKNWELTQSSTTSGAWEQLCYSLDAPGEDTGAVAAGNKYNTLVMFRDLGIGATTDEVIYFDNLQLPETPVGEEVTTVILDFEAPETTTDLFFFGSSLEGVVLSSIANPVPGGINTSDNVFQITKPAGALTYAGAFTEPNPTRPVNALNGGKICIDVYYDHIGTISIKCEQSTNGAPTWAATAANTKINEWETICIDFTTPSFEEGNTAVGNIYERVVLFTDFNEEGGATDVINYVDNLTVVTSAEVSSFDVTFSLNMNGSGLSFTQPYVSGEFNLWSGDANPLSDEDGDGIWTTTLPLDAGVYDYKFTFDNWAAEETLSRTNKCTKTTILADGQVITNRNITVAAPTTLPAVCFESCYECGNSAMITWNVGVNDPMPSGVWLAGGADFGAPGGNFQMSDEDGDGVFTITIERALGYETFYAFTNGNCPDFSCKENIAGQDCANPDNFNDRFLAAVNGNTEINTCFGECTTDTNCAAAPEKTFARFTVDMNQETVSADGVFIFGQFTNWSNVPMTDDNGDGVWEITLELSKMVFEYKFRNGTDTEESFEVGASCTVSTPDGMFTNRVVNLTGAGETTEVGDFCYNTCASCTVSTDDLINDNSLITIYPTLATQNIWIEINKSFTNGSVSIINLNGQKVGFQTLTNNKESIDISNLNNGTYILSFTTDTFRSTQKFIKINGL